MDYVMHTFKCKLSCNVKLCRPQRYSTREIPNSLPGNNIKNDLFLLIVSMYQRKKVCMILLFMEWEIYFVLLL